MDEAHALKNRHSIRAIKMRKVAGHCKARVMLTGAFSAKLEDNVC